MEPARQKEAKKPNPQKAKLDLLDYCLAQIENETSINSVVISQLEKEIIDKIELQVSLISMPEFPVVPPLNRAFTTRLSEPYSAITLEQDVVFPDVLDFDNCLSTVLEVQGDYQYNFRFSDGSQSDLNARYRGLQATER